MPKSGYFISYYTNETNVMVYLDNIVLNHRSGPLLQESDTYAFGGSIDALESRSFGRAENRYGYNGKEKQPDLGLEWYDFTARFNDVQIGRWTTVDPLAEKFSNWSTYVSMGDNPVLHKDPDGKKFVNFDSEGNYTGTTKDNKWHNFWHGSRGRVQNAEGKTEIKFNFSDANNDVADIESGKIKRIEFVKDGDIDNMMQKAGVFKSDRKSPHLGVENIKYAIKEGHGKLDFSYNGIPETYPEASRDAQNDQVPATPMIFLVKNPGIKGGKYGTAYNHMNFGNFLTGAALEALGFPAAAASVGAHINSIFRDHNGPDSSDDQSAINDGWNYGMSRGYRSKIVTPKIIVGPLE